MVRMVHPVHGVLNAIGTEVEWNKEHGWKVEEKANKKARPPQPFTPSPPPAVVPVVPPVPEFGTPTPVIEGTIKLRPAAKSKDE